MNLFAIYYYQGDVSGDDKKRALYVLQLHNRVSCMLSLFSERLTETLDRYRSFFEVLPHHELRLYGVRFWA
jgi:hypothetical protein